MVDCLTTALGRKASDGAEIGAKAARPIVTDQSIAAPTNPTVDTNLCRMELARTRLSMFTSAGNESMNQELKVKAMLTNALSKTTTAV